MEKPQWLTWAQEIQSIAQAGLAYSENPYDCDRYEQLRRLSIEMLESRTAMDKNIIKDLFASETGYQTPKVDVRGVVIQEELGIEAKAERLIAVWDRNTHVQDVFPFTVYKIFIDCSYISGSFEENTETHDARFFSRNNLPELSEGRNTWDQINYCFDFDRSSADKVKFD